MSREHIYFEDEWNEEYPIRKKKRIKNEFKRNKAKDNRSRTESGGATDKGSERRDNQA